MNSEKVKNLPEPRPGRFLYRAAKKDIAFKSGTEEEKRLIIRVSDTGCGVPEQYRESIFQPFFRVDKSRSRENGGVGLGLSLVWEIVTLHGGEVRVEESSEKGTTIAVKLPLDAQTD